MRRGRCTAVKRRKNREKGKGCIRGWGEARNRGREEKMVV